MFVWWFWFFKYFDFFLSRLWWNFSQPTLAHWIMHFFSFFWVWQCEQGPACFSWVWRGWPRRPWRPWRLLLREPPYKWAVGISWPHVIFACVGWRAGISSTSSSDSSWTMGSGHSHFTMACALQVHCSASTAGCISACGLGREHV